MSAPVTELTMPYWADMHAHLRQGEEFSAALIAEHLAGGTDILLAMPNTQPPLATVVNGEWSVQGYREMLLRNGGDAFSHLLVPLYLSAETTPAMIEQGARSGLLRSVKYYPPHGTTNSAHGVPLEALIGSDVLRAMEAHGIILNIHGEEHGLPDHRWFGQHENAESILYTEKMRRLRDSHPKLRIVCEHISTKEAVAFVKESGSGVVATVTPQHLTYQVGNLLKGAKLHLICMPLVKFGADVSALRQAVTAPDNAKFFAGTDSAPHPSVKKAVDCGCAFGCFTGQYGAQLYAEAFELAGVDLSDSAHAETFKRFLCLNGPAFYGLAPSKKTFVLRREPQRVLPTIAEGKTVIPLPLGIVPEAERGDVTIPWSVLL